MYSNVEAIDAIQSRVREQGQPTTLEELIHLEHEDRRDAGTLLEKTVELSVKPIDSNILPSGILSGVFAVRAVLLNPDVLDAFYRIRPDTDALTMIRARLTYGVPETDHLMAGDIVHTAVYHLKPDSGQELDDYFEKLHAWIKGYNAYEAELDSRFGGTWSAAQDEPFENPHPGDYPEKEFRIFTRYMLETPDLVVPPDDDIASSGILSRVEHELASVLREVKQKHPETSILSSRNSGTITSEELPQLARWFTD